MMSSTPQPASSRCHSLRPTGPFRLPPTGDRLRLAAAWIWRSHRPQNEQHRLALAARPRRVRAHANTLRSLAWVCRRRLARTAARCGVGTAEPAPIEPLGCAAQAPCSRPGRRRPSFCSVPNRQQSQASESPARPPCRSPSTARGPTTRRGRDRGCASRHRRPCPTCRERRATLSGASRSTASTSMCVSTGPESNRAARMLRCVSRPRHAEIFGLAR
jgi:hypothetical protein